MDKPATMGTFPATMRHTPLSVAFREVRHFKPDDWLHLEPLAVRAATMDWTIPAHRHEGLHQLQFLATGEAEVELDERHHAVRAPALLLIAPGCVHALRYAPGSQGEQITVPSDRLAHALSEAPALLARLRMSLVLQGEALGDDGAWLRAGCASLRHEFATDEPGRNEALQAHLVLLLTWVLRRAGASAGDDPHRALRDTLVQRYRQLIETHLRTPEPLAFFAHQLGVTPDHLSRSCRALTGLSALALLHERRALEARRLLAYTTATVAEIAHDLGFEDPSYFSRFFGRHMGQSPLDYRAALQTGQAVPP